MSQTPARHIRVKTPRLGDERVYAVPLEDAMTWEGLQATLARVFPDEKPPFTVTTSAGDTIDPSVWPSFVVHKQLVYAHSLYSDPPPAYCESLGGRATTASSDAPHIDIIVVTPRGILLRYRLKVHTTMTAVKRCLADRLQVAPERVWLEFIGERVDIGSKTVANIGLRDGDRLYMRH